MRPIPPNRKPCPKCDGLNTETASEEIEYGPPTNWQSRGNVAPNYRTKTVSYHYCNDCDWNEKYNP